MRRFVILLTIALAPLAHAADVDPLVARFAAALSGGDLAGFDALRADVPLSDESWYSVRETLERLECITVPSWQIADVTGDERSTTIHVVLDATGRSKGSKHREQRITPDWTLVAVRDAHGEWRLRSASLTARVVAYRVLAGGELAAEAAAVDPAFVAHELCDVAADVLVNKPDDPRGAAVLRRGLELAASSGDPTAQSYCWRMSSTTERLASRYDTAMAHAAIALSFAEQSAIPDEIVRGRFMHALAEWYGGDPRQGLAEMKRATDLVDEIDDPRLSLKALAMLSTFYRLRGDARSAVLAAQRLAALSKRYGWAEGEADAEIYLAMDHVALRHYDVAKEHFERAEELFQRGRNAPLALAARFNRSVITARMGDPKGAMKLIAEAIPFSDGAPRAVMYGSLAELQREQGELAAADQSIHHALAEVPPEEERLRRDFLTELSRIRRAQKRPAEAIEAARQAIRAKGDVPGVMGVEDPSSAAVALALALRDAGRKGEAVRRLREAIDSLEKERASTPQDIISAAGFFHDNTEPYIALGELLADAHKDGEAFRVAERMRARALADALRTGREEDSGMSDEEKAKEAALNRKIAALNRALLTARSAAEKKRLRAELGGARRLLEEHRTAMFFAHPELALKPLAAVQELKAIEGTAIVEYVVGEKRTLAFVVTQVNGSMRTRVYKLPLPRGELARVTARLGDMIAAHDLDYGRLAKRMYAMLLAPLENAFAGQASICIVPHDVLWRVPFQLLIDGNGRAVVDRFAVFYAPSVAMLTTATSRRTQKPKGQLLAIGNAKLDAAEETRIRAVYRDATLGPLIDAEREVREIGRLYGDAKILTGDNAREETFKRDASRFRVIHIATHGIVDDRAPMYSALALTATPDGDDGLLEAREILAMKLHADLAVLSACDTAGGSIDAGEGVIGLAWAFLVAGCPSTVVSQWDAESASTSELMIELHRQLRAGVSKPEALRRAAIALRRDRRYAHPFYWAPFIVVGAP